TRAGGAASSARTSRTRPRMIAAHSRSSRAASATIRPWLIALWRHVLAHSHSFGGRCARSGATRVAGAGAPAERLRVTMDHYGPIRPDENAAAGPGRRRP